MKWASARDSYVWDEQGRRYLDFTSGGIFTANVGNCNDYVLQAVRTCLWNELVSSYTYPTAIRERYEAKLLEVTGFEACALFCSGTDAVEAAIRVMGDDYIQAVPDSFHGKSYGVRRHLIRDSYPRLLSHWIVEGYGGWDAKFWPIAFIQYLQECQDEGRLICFDEVQSGFGRTGRMFAYEHYGIKPDIVVIGKGMGGGLPISGILSSKALLEAADLSSTHGGNPVMCAAALAVLEEMERLDLINESARKGELLHKWLKEALPDVKIQGRGMVGALLTDSVDKADAIVSACRKLGLLVVQTGRPSVKLGPPLTIPDEVLEQGVEILAEAVNEYITARDT